MSLYSISLLIFIISGFSCKSISDDGDDGQNSDKCCVDENNGISLSTATLAAIIVIAIVIMILIVFITFLIIRASRKKMIQKPNEQAHSSVQDTIYSVQNENSSDEPPAYNDLTKQDD